jgi:hypothetical protein
MLFLALGLSLVVKMVVVLIPLRWYSKYLDRSGKPVTQNRNNSEDTIIRIKNAVSRCSRFAPWKTKCLVDAVTAKLLLQWHGINSTLYLGVDKDENNKLIAHAWLKCGEKFITGRKGYQKFTVVSTFA